MEWSSVLRRVAFAALAALVVVSFVFGFVMLTEDPNEALIQYQLVRQGDASAEEVQSALAEYRSERGRNRPLHQQYLDFLVGTATLNWGISPTFQAPVRGVLAKSLVHTALWVVPAIALSVAGGVAIGLYSALRQRTVFDRLAIAVSYLGLGLPNYVLAISIPLVFGMTVEAGGLGSEFAITRLFQALAGSDSPAVTDLRSVVLPSLVLTTSLLAGQMRHVRSEAMEYAGTDFVKLIQARGASPWTVARHVGRNAAIPLLSLFFADMLGVLVINVIVLETILSIPGVGTLTYVAFFQRDLPLLLGVTTLIMVVGIAGNFLQDLAYATLDPRVDAMD